MGNAHAFSGRAGGGGDAATSATLPCVRHASSGGGGCASSAEWHLGQACTGMRERAGDVDQGDTVQTGRRA
eukprot:363655-Chlamydomonas_euryale.AAC.2